MTRKTTRTTPDEVLGHRLRAARDAAGKTQPDAAARAGVVVHTIVNWEHGRTKIPATTLASLARMYNTTAAALLESL